jgi:hypothetical protein
MEVPLSQTQKKSGGRDISDLKARLGLKKGGPASKSSGAVVAPPGLKSRGAVPVPPGAKAPEPQLPSASDDPFAHMNAMAAVGVAQRAPEIIVVNDGKPVETVDTKSRAVTMAKYGGMVLIPLIVGIALGQISKTAKAVNKTIDHSANLHKDVNRIRTGVYDFVVTPLLEAQERGQGGKFLIHDPKLDEALQGNLKQLPSINPETAFRSYMFDMDENLVGDILFFYSEAAQLRKDLEAHVEAAKLDSQAIKAGDKKLVEARPDASVNEYLKASFSRYGIILEVPNRKEAEQGKQFGAKLVEVGPPVCQDGKTSSAATCPGPPRGFGYREVDSGEGWRPAEFGFPEGENVPGKKILPLLDTRVLTSLLKGGGAAAAETAYKTRVEGIAKRATELVEFGTSIEKTLKAKANQSKSFTFFL